MVPHVTIPKIGRTVVVGVLVTFGLSIGDPRAGAGSEQRRWVPRSRRLRRTFVVMCGAVAASAATVSGHDMGRHLTDEELVTKADSVVHGQVLNVRSEWNQDRTVIFTYVDIRVDETIKGSVPNNQLKLRLLGGTVGDIGMTVFGGPSAFSKDEEVILFLEKNTRSFFPVVGVHEGKLTVVPDHRTGVKVLNAPHREPEPLPTFKARIRGLVAKIAQAAPAKEEVVPDKNLPQVEEVDGKARKAGER